MNGSPLERQQGISDGGEHVADDMTDAAEKGSDHEFRTGRGKKIFFWLRRLF